MSHSTSQDVSEPEIQSSSPPLTTNRLENITFETDPQQPVQTPNLSQWQTFTTLLLLVADIFIASFTAGLLTASLPLIAASLRLPANLLLWPSSANALTSASMLLLAGSVSDLVGARRVWLVGSFCLGTSLLACSLARSGVQLIVFRALQGIAASLCLTTSASFVTKCLPAGRMRNLAFGFLGLSQPLGFSVGLVLGGLLAEKLGWRSGWYASAASYAVIFSLGIFTLPSDPPLSRQDFSLHKLDKDVDWVGAIIASACLALFSSALATISADLAEIRKARALVLLTISVMLVPAFFFWMRLRERQQKWPLIPNSLWRSRSFNTFCIMLLSSYGIEDAMELLCSLYFQNVQMTSAVQSSVRMLPMCIVGTLLNIATALFVHSVSATNLVLLVSLLSTVAPLLMAVTNPKWPYWYSEFPSQLLMPLSIDVLYTVGIILASEVFPENRQALAAGVFNTAGQLGVSVGLTVVGAISRSTTLRSSFSDKNSPGALLTGYKAGFWMAFAWALVACIAGCFGLTKLGKIGLKRE